ncbi:MAG: hypothetical protein E6J95_01785 [Methanobacteriota archaeon]|nr:MAG: hypothetical protein E6J95_01785 [Euryarchaeota archaeon]
MIFALVLAGFLVAGTLGALVEGGFLQQVPGRGSPGSGLSSAAAGRDPLKWPFSRDSIWNLPIGSNARYVWAGIRHATSMAYFNDADILVLTPSAPSTTVYANYDDWGSGNRCSAQGGALFDAPMPANFVIPGSHQGSEDGDTPNAAAALLAADGHSLIQTQPFARCAGQSPTSHYMFWPEDLYGTGETGSHGGSGLSALGGTVRLGELVPGGTIRHSLKLNLDSANYYSGFGGYRWPAVKSDAGGAGYGGSIPEDRMGSLLAVKPDFAIGGLETEPGKIVARAFMDYGGYIVDSSGWSIYNFVTEHSPDGSIYQEFPNSWGYPLNAGVGANGWARDLDKIFTNLYVVDSWDKATWLTVSASNGTIGVGLGTPRVPWAPEFGQAPPPPPPPPPGDSTPPVSTISLAGTQGAAGWYRSSVSATIGATDVGSGVASIHLRVDGGSWTVYQSPATIAGTGSHTLEFYATDVAGNQEATQSSSFKIDANSPATTAALSGTSGSGTWYRSPVTVTLSATDSGSGLAGIRTRTDGAAWASYSSPFGISGEGSHTFDFYATDVAGNTESTRTRTLGIDATLPSSTAQVQGTPSGSGYQSPVTVSLAGSDATSGLQSLSYRIDGGADWAYTTPFHVAGNGSYHLEYFATDQAGNREVAHSITLQLVGSSGGGGTHAPPVTTSNRGGTRGANGWYVSPVDVTLTASSPAGSPTMIAYRIDGGNWAGYTSSFSLTGGRRTIDFQASDADGFLSPLQTLTVDVDYTPPTITSAIGDVIAPDGTLSWTGTDDVAGVAQYEVSIDGGPFVSMGTGTSVRPTWTIGSHTANVRALDNAGNMATKSISFRVQAGGAPSDPGLDLVGPFQAAPPGSLYLTIGFIMIIVGLLLINRQQMDRRARMRPRRTTY